MTDGSEELLALFGQAHGQSTEEKAEFIRGVLARDPSLGEQLAALLAQDDRPGPVPVDPTATPLPKPGSDAPRLKLEPGMRLGEFVLVTAIGRGGQAVVWEAEQPELGRRVALKLLHPGRIDERSLERFRREAVAGARLTHPNLVTVLDWGEDDGFSWLAQELVPGGRTLRHVIENARVQLATPPDWYRHVATITRDVADALQAIHAAGILHRDVKPQNILQAPDGTPKLTDFGIAHLQNEPTLSGSGEMMPGTCLYMSPEQVRARRTEIDARTDIFSLGVVLYELLTLQRPFEGDTAPQICMRILNHDPQDPRKLRSQVPRDLSVICCKALEKDRGRRYTTMSELSDDLKRWLTHEPIHATPPTRLDRVSKWCRRNPTKSVAAGLASAALAVIWVLMAAYLGEVAASSRRAEEVLRLSALQELEDLLVEARTLWPAHPALIPGFEAWIERSCALVEDLPYYEAKRSELRALARPRTQKEHQQERETHPDYGQWQEVVASLSERTVALAHAGNAEEERAIEHEVARLKAERIELDLRLNERREWHFTEQEGDARWREKQLSKLIAGLRVFESDLLAEGEVTEEHGWSVTRRLEFARTISSAEGNESRARWSEAIATVSSSTAYGDLELSPQVGLWPIGEDPRSGLMEFGHLPTGEPPGRDEDGRLVLTPETGLVLVLIPGGTFRMGAQASNPAAPNYDPRARSSEGPVHEVSLSPYFLSKYEMTQEQWTRICGVNPSRFSATEYDPLFSLGDNEHSPLLPVEEVNWYECQEVLRRVALAFPSEAQWEFAAAGADRTHWPFPPDEVVEKVANFADARTSKFFPALTCDPWDDGWAATAPVGSLLPNGLGLHDMFGNVFEWCLDGYDPGFYSRFPAVDPVGPNSAQDRIRRGGAWDYSRDFAQVFHRNHGNPADADLDMGLRPARAVAAD